MKKILIVEDNELNMKLFQDLLTAHHYVTVPSRGSMEVLDLVAREQPDLILMDIQLPGISGIDLTRHLKAGAASHHIPIIALTAFAMKGDEEKIRASGCDAYLSKPISIRTFLQTIEKQLESK